MELTAFTLLRYLMVHSLLLSKSFGFNLDKLNLANSKITSIEHITMNPSEELYAEYYSDYDFTSDNYDHIGDIEDLDLIFPTLGRDELNLSIGPMALSVAEVGDFTRDYGTYIGDIKSHSHQIRGHVYIVDSNHIYIRKFSYDGGGSLDAYFWVGSDKQPSPKGRLVPYPSHNGIDRKTGKPLPLPEMRSENILLTLPPEMNQNPRDITSIKWLSVWCTRFTVNFAEIFIPRDPKVPRQFFLERFPHVKGANIDKLNSDTVQILDDKTFYIPDFYLHTGGSKGYKFQACLGPCDNKFTVDIPNENNRYDDLVDYNGRDVLIVLPGQTTMYDITRLMVVDTIQGRDLGWVEIPRADILEGHPIPPSLGQNAGWWPEPPSRPPSTTHTPAWHYVTGPTPTTPPPKLYNLPNCREFLGRRVRLLWKSFSDHIYFRLQAKTREEEYAALGFVPYNTQSVDADVLKFYLNSTNRLIMGVDSFLSESQNCGFDRGLCSDTSYGRYNDIMIVDTDRHSDVMTIDFIKNMAADHHDPYDVGISSHSDTQILVAIGNMHRADNRGGQVRFSRDNGTINFNNEVAEECLAGLQVTTDESSVSWRVPFRTRKDTRNFEVRLGPPGGDKGYKAITGLDPPFIGMCWWINGLLMPELTVYRGQTYYFKVQGGDNEFLGKQNYHPFYITSDPNGGYGRKIEAERDGERVWAGVDNVYGEMSTMMEPKPTAKGNLCYYKSKEGEDKWREAETFKDYFATLDIVCDEGSRDNYGLLNWTVAEETDDIVYYQSYTHENLGWKIRVLSPGENSSPSISCCNTILLLIAVLTIVVHI